MYRIALLLLLAGLSHSLLSQTQQPAKAQPTSQSLDEETPGNGHKIKANGLPPTATFDSLGNQIAGGIYEAEVFGDLNVNGDYYQDSQLLVMSRYPAVEPMQALVHNQEDFFCQLNLQGTGSGNVMQGFVFDNRSRHIYVSHRYGTNPEYSIINKFSLNGTGIPTNLGYSNAITVGHPQDLSIEYLDGSIRLWTSSQSERGVSRINYNGSSTSYVSYELFDSIYKSTTPTISTNGKYIVVRGVDEANPTTNDHIFVYELAHVLAGGNTPIHDFIIDPDQMVSNQWFQGIVCDNDIIYCMTGNNLVANNKKLYAYSFDGKVLYKKELTTGKADAQNTGSGAAWEPEGMSLYQPHPHTKVLLLGIVSGDSGNRIKRVYSMGLGRAIIDVNGDYHPHDVGLHFSGGSKDMSYYPTHAFQIGQWDGSTWTERVRLNSLGNLGVGTTTPGYRLQVGNSGDGSSARANSWTTFSDRRWKKDLELIPDPLAKLQQLNGYYFYWDQRGDTHRQAGVMAQEVEAVLPEIVETDVDGYKSVDYAKLSPLLIEAVKELQSQLDQKDQEIESLREEMDKRLLDLQKQIDTK